MSSWHQRGIRQGESIGLKTPVRLFLGSIEDFQTRCLHAVRPLKDIFVKDRSYVNIGIVARQKHAPVQTLLKRYASVTSCVSTEARTRIS